MSHGHTLSNLYGHTLNSLAMSCVLLYGLEHRDCHRNCSDMIDINWRELILRMLDVPGSLKHVSVMTEVCSGDFNKRAYDVRSYEYEYI